MLNEVLFNGHAESRYAEWRYAEWCFADCHGTQHKKFNKHERENFLL
jgi:hypothetical protein